MTRGQDYQKSKTWYRDGFIVTDDISMIDLGALEGSTSEEENLEKGGTAHHLVLFTPSPPEDDPNPQIGYLLIERHTTTRTLQISKLVMNQRWRNQGLEKWLLDCAEEWLKERGASKNGGKDETLNGTQKP